MKVQPLFTVWNNMVGVITAGGRGTRLSSIANDIPKPMVSILNKPILQYQIECLRNNNIIDIYILIGHLGNVIKAFFKDGTEFGVHIHYIEEQSPLGSAGALYFLRDIINDDFVFVFGDLMLDVDFKRMIAFHQSNGATITLLSHPNSHPFDSDLIQVDNNNMVLGIDSKHNKRDYYYRNLVNAGVYVVSNKIFDLYFKEPIKVDFEKDVVSLELKNNTVYSYHSTEYVKDAGTPDRYYSVCDDVKNGIVSKKNLSNPQKCIFLDRDGTINRYKGFIRKIDDIELEPYAAAGIKKINKSEYLVIVITNQPVIARGEVTFEQLDSFHSKVETLLGEEGAYYDDLFYCPHHPDKGFDGEIPNLKLDCQCRKPKIGLLLVAKNKYNIDFSKSFFVGDTTTDIQTGINAGMKTILVRTGVKGADNKYQNKPDYIIDNLNEIDRIIRGE